MTPEGRCHVFSADLDSPGRPGLHTIFTGNPQNLQKMPKTGVPPFGQFFRKSPLYRTPIASRWLEVRFPPIWAILGGGRTFRQNLKI